MPQHIYEKSLVMLLHTVLDTIITQITQLEVCFLCVLLLFFSIIGRWALMSWSSSLKLPIAIKNEIWKLENAILELELRILLY